jgi:hypothetical protein
VHHLLRLAVLIKVLLQKVAKTALMRLLSLFLLSLLRSRLGTANLQIARPVLTSIFGQGSHSCALHGCLLSGELHCNGREEWLVTRLLLRGILRPNCVLARGSSRSRSVIIRMFIFLSFALRSSRLTLNSNDIERIALIARLVRQHAVILTFAAALLGF